MAAMYYGEGPSVWPADDVLREIGRVAVASANLESVVARMHAVLLDREPPRVVETWSGSRTRDQLLRALPGRLSADTSDLVRRWLTDVAKMAEQRDRAVHAKAVLAFVDDSDWRPAGFHPRTGTFLRHDVATLRDLASRIADCATAGMVLMSAMAKAGEIERPTNWL